MHTIAYSEKLPCLLKYCPRPLRETSYNPFPYCSTRERIVRQMRFDLETSKMGRLDDITSTRYCCLRQLRTLGAEYPSDCFQVASYPVPTWLSAPLRCAYCGHTMFANCEIIRGTGEYHELSEGDLGGSRVPTLGTVGTV